MIDMEHSPNELNDVLLQLQAWPPKLLNEEPENHGFLKVQWPGYVDVSKLVTQINQNFLFFFFPLRHAQFIRLLSMDMLSQWCVVPWAEPVVVKRVLDLGAQSLDAQALGGI